MLKDSRGLDITTDSREAVSAINGFIDCSLRYGRDAEVLILQAVKADPTCAIANAYAAAYYLSQENITARRQAVFYLKVATQKLGRVSERERLYINAIAAWAKGAICQAIDYHETIAQQFPQDLISVQQGQYHYFYQGNESGLLQIAETVLPENQEDSYLLSMVAFGLEQCGRLPQAEELGRRAVALNRDNPWAHHAVAHIMEAEGRVDEGIVWMEGLAPTWENCNSMLYTHNWLHIALFYLTKVDLQMVIALYHHKIWNRAQKDSPKDQVTAISLLVRLEIMLVRLEMRRDAVEDFWKELVPYLLPRIHEHTLPLHDLHYVYALARTGQVEQVNEMLASMANHAQKLESRQRGLWTEIIIPAAEGMAAHASRDMHGTIAYFKPILSSLWAIGGSSTQRHLFKQIYLDALRRNQQQDDFSHRFFISVEKLLHRKKNATLRSGDWN
ncbi:tetratricopeptide repeat protein [Phormidesmis sp. 146-12]